MRVASGADSDTVRTSNTRKGARTCRYPSIESLELLDLAIESRNHKCGLCQAQTGINPKGTS